MGGSNETAKNAVHKPIDYLAFTYRNKIIALKQKTLNTFIF